MAFGKMQQRQPFIRRSIRTRLLILLLGLIVATIGLNGYIAFSALRIVEGQVEQITAEVMDKQATDFLRQVTVSDAQKHTLLFRNIEQDAAQIAQYAAEIFNHPDRYLEGYWDPEERMHQRADGQYANGKDEPVSVFVPNFVTMDESLLTKLRLSAHLDPVLASIYESNPDAVAVYVALEGEITRYYPNIDLASVVPPDFQVTQRPWYLAAAPENNIGRKVVWSEVYLDATGKGLLVTVAAPIYTERGEFVGVVGIDLSLEGLAESIEWYQVMGSGYSFLIDGSGRGIAMSNQAYLDVLGRPPAAGEIAPDLVGEAVPEFAPILAEMREGKTGVHTLFVNGREIYVAYAPVGNQGWSMANVAEAYLARQALEALRGSIRETTLSSFQRWVVPLGILLLLVASGFGSLFTYRVVRPLREMAVAARRIGSGEWDVPLPPPGDDEVGVLATALARMKEQLQEMVGTLEQRVAERTAALTRRTAQLEAAVEVARGAAAIRDIDTLLNEVVRLISDRFGFYHTGIFLLDDAGEYAVLRAASSEGGQRMLRRGHRLKVGEVGIVGYVAGTGEPRIALDVGKDAVFFDNPDLPLTRSEMALPLKVRDKVIGVLDVQSDQPAAFTEEDIAVLQAMADQIALGIENARLFQESQRTLEELQIAYGEHVRMAWEELRAPTALVYDRIEVTPAEPAPDPLVEEALEKGEIVAEVDPEEERSTVVAPLRLRDQIIGAIAVEETDEARPWTREELELVEAVTEQVALALDSARLYAEAQERAAEQEALARIAGVASTTLDLHELLTQLVEEARQVVDAESAALLLVDEEANALIARYISAAGELVLPEEWIVPLDAPGMEVSVFARGGVYYSNRGVDDPNVIPAYLPYMEQLGVRNFCGVALRVRDRSIGELYVANRAGGFGQNEARLLQAVAGYAASAIENARLFAETQQRMQELAMLFDASQQLAGAPLQPEGVAGIVARQFVEVLGIPEASVSLLDPTTGMMRVVADFYLEERGKVVQEEEVEAFSLKEYPATARVMETLQPLVVYASDPDADPAELAYMQEYEVQTLIILPLAVKGRAIGVIELEDWTKEVRITQAQMNLAMTLANQAAVAVENARLFEEARLHAEELATLNQMAQALTARLSVEGIMEETYKGASRLLDTTNFYIALYDPETDLITFPLAVEEGKRVAWRSRKRGNGLTEYILRTKQPLLIPENVTERLQELGIELFGKVALSWMGVPIMLGDQVLGVLAVQSYTAPRAYGEHHLDLLTAIASQMAIALQNARLFEEVQEERSRLATLYEVSRRLGEAPTLEEAAAAALEVAPYVGAQYADLILLDVGGHPFLRSSVPERVEYTAEQAEEYIRQVTTRGLQAWVLEHRQSALVVDTHQDDRWLILPGHKRGDPVRSVICVPLFDRRGQVMGTLSYTHPEPGAFSEEEQRLVEEVAARVAVTLENARLFAETQEALAETEELYQAGAALNAAQTYDDILQVLCDYSVLGDADRAAHILLFNRPWVDGDVPEWAIRVARRSSLPLDALPSRYAPRNFPAAQVLLRPDEIVVLSDLENDPRLDDNTRTLYLQALQARCAIFVPLIVAGQWIGFASGLYSEPREFAEEDLRHLRALAGQAAVAVQSIRRLEETRQALAETEALYKAARLISEATSIEGILRGAAEIAEQLDFEACSITIATLTDPEGVPTHGDIYTVIKTEEGWTPIPPARAFPIQDRDAARRVLDEPDFVVVYPDMEGPEAEIPEPVREVTRAMGMRGMITAGLSLLGRALGFLTFTSQRPITGLWEKHIRRIRTIADQVAVALENRRLLEETTRRAAQLETAAEVSGAASSILDLEELLPRTVELIRQRFDLYYVGIFLLDETGRWAVLRAGTGEAGQKMLEQGHRLEVGGRSMIGWCTAHGEARIALDVGAEAVRFDNPLLPETRSEMALPLISRGRVIGAMTIQSDKPAAFTEEDITALQTMADQLATAIENARLFAETQRSLKETQELYETGRAIGAAATPAEVGRALVEYAAHTDLSVARLLLFEFEDDEPIGLTMAESWTVDGRPVHPYGTRLPMEEYAIARLLQSDEPLIVEDVHADPRLDEPSRLLAEVAQIRSFAIVPLNIGSRLVGGLLVGRDVPSTFSERLLNNLWTLCGQAAIAVENLRLLEETRRRAQELEAINEISRAITSVLDLESVVRQIVDTTKERFGHYFVSLLLVEEDRLIFEDGSTIGDTDRRVERGKIALDLQRPSITTDAVRTRQPVLVNDVLLDPRYVTVPELSDARSELAVPIEVKGQVIGVLDVQSDRPYAYSRTDILLLQSLAAQAGVAIENARLFAEVEATARRRALINEVLQAGATSLDPDDLLHRVGEAISLRLEMPCGIFEWDSEAEGLRPVVVYDPEGVQVPLPEKISLITAEAIPAMFEAIRTRQLRVVLDVPSHVRGPVLEFIRAFGVQDAAYVPLIARERVLGLLSLGRQPGHPPLDEDELEFLQIVGANLSVAWENARLYQEAVETAERLKEIDRLKSQFLANMSHELRTPLNSIIGFSRVILKGIDGPITEMQRQDLEAIYNSGQHLLGLINDILDISKIEAGKMELDFKPVDLKEVIHGVMSTAIALVKDKPIELQQSVPADLPTIIADERRVRQILLNLVSNAAKFTDEGFIRVEVTYDDEYVTISVSDTGIGIPEDKLPKIFEAFTQVDASPSRKYGGTGLGLTITKSFIELHGGEIWVESEVGKGSTFTFRLPIQGPPTLEEEEEEEPAAEEAPQPSGAEEAAAPSGKVVLCVDDDEGVITLFRRYLHKQGYQVVGLTDPSRVVEEAKRLKPYAITLDVMMPEKDGWQVIQELKGDPETKDIPVVMCTIVGDKGKGLSLGAADYLVKPILEQDLLSALDRLDREEGRHRVLVVDDQAEDRELLRRIIEGQDGFEVVEASSGQEAIALVKRVRPHIVILDLLMPEVDGFAVLEALKADKSTRNIPIIVVTAKELTEKDRALLNHRIEALVQKGLLDQEELLQDVLAALKKIGRGEDGV
ncbi:MAG TPA: GAF domain-containing protein [Chloroflexi bacterium]|nr:GAF domain-containing protein [Chloroflexota bacterium]